MVLAGGLLALVLLAVGRRPAAGAAPPMPSGKLTAEQQKRLGKLRRDLDSATFAGRMVEALRLAREIEAFRRRWQGPGHWQTINARYAVERWQRLALLSEADQKQAGRAARRSAEAGALLDSGRYVEAEKIEREALAIRKEVLGEQHPDTATSYNIVVSCLHAQGKYPQALALADKALDICKKVLGEQHPDTARGYNNVAAGLTAQGQHTRALPLYKKALARIRKVLGDNHPITARTYNSVAACLDAQGKYAQAYPLHEKALAIFKKVFGEHHLETAAGYNFLASSLDDLGKPAQALPLYEKALTIRRRVLGERHSATATSYNNVAYCLQRQGQPAQAQPLYEKALAIYKAVLSENHPSTATCYNNLAICLKAQGHLAQALPLYEKALAICKKVLGEQHDHTAQSYNNLALCLHHQGKLAQAQLLYEKALAICKRVLDERHPLTAACYDNLASCLYAQGKYAQAQLHAEKASAIFKKVLGEQHPDTSTSYNMVAVALYAQGKHAQALQVFETALSRRKKASGERHPETALGYYNMAACLDAQGKTAEALAHYKKALAIRKEVLGEEHPDTAQNYNYLAYCLYYQSRVREAIPNWQAALLGHDAARLARASSGFERALAGAFSLTPLEGLALAHARLNEPGLAWGHAEAGLARNLLDDLARAAAEDASLLSHLRRLDERLVSLFGRDELSADQEQLRDDLARQRRDVLARVSKHAAARSARLVWPLRRIQKQLAADAAVVLWLSVRGENWAAVVRSQGLPHWQRLTGTGAKEVWTADDYQQPDRLHQALADAGSSQARRRELIEGVRQRWFAPLRPHLAADGKLPAVRRLYVVPSKFMAALSVEVIAPKYVVSYTPSATVLAQAFAGHRPLKADSAMALGDPVFQASAPAAAPKAGVLITEVLAGGNAARAGLRAGDVLLRFGDARLETMNDLAQALKKNGRAEAVYWRQEQERRVALAGPLGVRVDRRAAPAAVAAWRAENASVTRGESYGQLPGTRAEVLALQRLLGKGCRILLGSNASEQALDQLAQTGELKRCRLLHLATHATLDLDRPERSAVILARDRLPGLAENAERAARGLKPYTGELTVDTILRGWKLDADLVVLSACRTGLGRQSSGEGLLGFSYALMRVGARSVVLSRWKVDDTATALLMLRFYENLLGKRKELKKPLGKAEALAEAAKWLRELPRKDAERLAAALGEGKLAGTARGSVGELKLKPGDVKLPAGGRPYAHPYYWAAFTLIGDPD
jgi:tetratricopeptide (TPR) repeat protein